VFGYALNGEAWISIYAVSPSEFLQSFEPQLVTFNGQVTPSKASPCMAGTASPTLDQLWRCWREQWRCYLFFVLHENFRVKASQQRVSSLRSLVDQIDRSDEKAADRESDQLYVGLTSSRCSQSTNHEGALRHSRSRRHNGELPSNWVLRVRMIGAEVSCFDPNGQFVS
jgi:hypothetical protein